MNVVRPQTEEVGWQGMTIKDILEKVDLFNVSTLMEEDLDLVKPKNELVGMATDKKPSIKSLQVGQKSSIRDRHGKLFPTVKVRQRGIDILKNGSLADPQWFSGSKTVITVHKQP